MAERPLYTLYKGLKADNFDVPSSYDSFERTLVEAGNGGATARHTLFNSLKSQGYDVPDTYESFYRTLFTPVNRTTSKAIGGDVPMSEADKRRFSAGAANISALAGQTMQNAGRYNKLKNRQKKQKTDFGRVNIGSHQTPYGGDADNVVKDDFAYNPETGKAGTYVNSDSEDAYNLAEAEQKQAALDKQNQAYQESVNAGDIPSVFDVRDKNGNYDLQENVGKDGTYVTEEGVQAQYEKKLADAYARKKELEGMIAADNEKNGNPLLSYSASVGAGNGSSQDRRMMDAALNQVKAEINSLEAVTQTDKNAWYQNMQKAMENTAFTAKTWDFGINDFALMGQLERIKAKMDQNIPLNGMEKTLLKSKVGADAAAALEDDKMGAAYRWTKIAGQSLPFMADFFLTGGYGGITKATSNAALKFAAKKGMGKLGAAILKNTGVVGADIIGSYAMAGTEQAMKTGADIMQRHMGNLYQDENGNYKFGTFDENGNLLHEGGESMGKALYKGMTAAMLENYTEKIFGHNYGLKKGALKFMENHGMARSAEFFKNIGQKEWYAGSKKWMEKFGINGFAEEVMEEEINIPLNALLVGDNKMSDILDPKQQMDIIGGMALSVGSMYALGAGTRPLKGVYNRAQYYRYKNKVNNSDTDAYTAFGSNDSEKWEALRDKIDNAPNEKMGGVLASIIASRDELTKDQIDTAVHYGINLMKMRGYNLAKTEEMNAKEMTGETATPEEQHDEEVETAYSEGHDAEDADKHNIQMEAEDQMAVLTGILGITEQQLSGMTDEELESLTGQDDKLDQAIYDYQLSTARYQGVVDNANDKVEAAAQQASHQTDMLTDKSRGTVRNATVIGINGEEDYGVYIISGKLATHEDGAINIGDSDSMIIYYDPKTQSVEHADARRFVALGDEVPAEEVKAQAIADAKEAAIKAEAGIIDGTVEVGTQFSTTDTDGSEHTYEVLADNGDGTAMITIDGNVEQNPYTFEELQTLKDAEDLKRLNAAKAQRGMMEEQQKAQEEEQKAQQQKEDEQKNAILEQITNADGNVQLIDVIDENGDTKYPGSQVFLISEDGAKAKIMVMDADGNLKPHAVNKEDIVKMPAMTADEYKQTLPASNIEEDRGEIEADTNKKTTPEQEALLNGHNPHQYQPAQESEEGKLLYRNNGGAQTEQTQPSASVTTSQEGSAGSSDGKGTNNSAENNENNETLTLEDGTVVPMLEDGNPDFSQLTAEQTAELYDSQFGEDAEQIISGFVSEAKKALDKATNMTVKGKNFAEQKASKAEKDKAISVAQTAYDSAKAISDAYAERQLRKELDTHEGRMNLIQKAKNRFSRLKNKEEWKNNPYALWNETVGKVLHRLYDGTSVDVFDTIPLTVEEYVSSSITPFSLNFEGKENSKGVAAETGLQRKDFAKSHVLAAEGKGKTVDEFVHKLWNDRPKNLENVSDQDIRTALLDLITSDMNAYNMSHVIEDNRIAQAEEELENNKRAAENAAFEEEQRKVAEEEAKKQEEEAKKQAEAAAKAEEEAKNAATADETGKLDEEMADANDEYEHLAPSYNFENDENLSEEERENMVLRDGDTFAEYRNRNGVDANGTTTPLGIKVARAYIQQKYGDKLADIDAIFGMPMKDHYDGWLMAEQMMKIVDADMNDFDAVLMMRNDNVPLSSEATLGYMDGAAELIKARHDAEKLGLAAFDSDGNPVYKSIINLANWAKEQGLEVDGESAASNYANLYLACKDGFGVTTLVPDKGEEINMVFYFPEQLMGDNGEVNQERLSQMVNEFNEGRDALHSAEADIELTDGAQFYNGDTAREFRDFVDKKAEEENKPFGEQIDESELPFSVKEGKGKKYDRAADVEKNHVSGMEVVDDVVGSKTRKAFDRLAKMMGAKIQWQYSDKMGNGWYDEKVNEDGSVERTIYLTLDSSIMKGAQFIFGHEMTHEIKSKNPAAYEELKNLIINTYGKEAFDKAVDETEKRYREAGVNYTGGRAAYEEEVVADGIGEMIRDLNLAHTLALKMSHPLLAYLHEILMKIKRAFYGTEYSDKVKEVIRGIEQAYVKTAKGDFASSSSASGERFSLRDEKVNETSDKFDAELQQQIDGKQEKGHIYNIGMPSPVLLSTGVPNLPIHLNAARLKVKATKFGHDFDLNDIKGFVKAIQNPIAIFAYGDKDKAQNIILELSKDGKNFIVGLSLNPLVGGKHLYINSIRNVFPKNNGEWLNWISQGKALYLDKEKVQTLIDQQRTNLADVEYLNLDSVAKITNDFENPAIEGEDLTNNNENVKYSLRQKEEPKKKGIGYKVFLLGKDGKLYPPMVANPNGAATPVGVWLDADAAPIAGESKTGRPQVKQGGKGTQGGSGKLAYRPGWHLGVIPYALQFNRKDAEGNKTLFPKNFVFAEVEYAADVDYQQEAHDAGINPSGKYQHSLAGLKHLPTDGYYMYRTNPNPETDPWVITGAMKVNRILTRAEQAELVKKAGREPQMIQDGDIVTDEIVNAINQEIANAPKFSLKVYHGSGADFTEFDFDHMGEGAGSQAFGWGGYVTTSKKIGKSYAQSGMQTRTVMVKNNDKWFEFSDGDPMFKAVDEAMYLIKSEGLRGARNFANRWKEDADTEEVRQQWTKVADLLNNHVKADFKSRYPSHLYEVDIPDDNGKNYLEWSEKVPTDVLAKIGGVLDERGIMMSDATTNGNMKASEYLAKYKDDWDGKSLYIELNSDLGGQKEASKLLSDAGFTGIKYPAGTIMGGAEEGDINYVIFKPEDMNITEHTKFSLRSNNNLFGYFDGTIKDLIDSAKTSGSKLIKKIISTADDKLIGDLHDKGVDITSDYKHTIDNNAINHAIKRHGSEKERLQGQLPITEKDLENVGDVIDNYDSIETEKNKRGQDVIIYTKQYADGTTYYIEEVRTGRKELAMDSIRKRKTRKLTDANSNATPISDLSSGNSAAKIDNNSETAKEKGEKVDSDAPKTFEEFLESPSLKFQIRNEEQRKAAESAYNWAVENRPDKWNRYALVNMANPQQMPEYYEKKALADKWRRYENKVGVGARRVITDFKLFDLNKPFEENVVNVKGKVPEEFDPRKLEKNQAEIADTNKQKKELEDKLETLKEVRFTRMDSILKKYMDEHKLSNEYEVPDDVWMDARKTAYDEYTAEADKVVEQIGELDKKLKALSGNEVRYSLKGDDFKKAQLNIINETNPILDDYHTGIRKVEDIKTFQEAYDMAKADKEKYGDEQMSSYPDLTDEILSNALKIGKITIYSSKPIENGNFVTPSRMQAEDYAGGGKVYEKNVPLNDVAWIDVEQGQYAKVDDTRFSIKTYHGTGAKFDNFDLSHALEGEGSETFGHGVYVTNSGEIGADYAKRAKGKLSNNATFNVNMGSPLANDWFKYFYRMVGNEGFEDAKKYVIDEFDQDIKMYSSALEGLKADDRTRKRKESTLDEMKRLREQIANTKEEDLPDMPHSYRYDVEIPDDNGTNYLDWGESIKNIPLEKWAEMYDLLASDSGYRDAGINPTDRIYRIIDMKLDTPEGAMFQNRPTLKGEELYHALEDFYNREEPGFGAERASECLSKLGFAGIKYKAGMIHGGAKEGDYNYVIFNEKDAKIVGNTKFSLKYNQFEKDLEQWKKDNGLKKDAQRPAIPTRDPGESAVDFMKKVNEYRRQMALWKTAPTYEGHLLTDGTALGEFNRELQRGSVLKRIAFQDSMLAIRKAQEAIMKEHGVDKISMAEDAYTAENRSHGKGKNELEEYNDEFLQPLRKAYKKMKDLMDGSYDNVKVYMMAKHGLERNALMAFKKALENDFEKVDERVAAYNGYKADVARMQNDADFNNGRIDYATWRQRDNGIRTKYAPSYPEYRYDKDGNIMDYSGLTALFEGTPDIEVAASDLVKNAEDKYSVETADLWNAVNAATKKILRDSYKAGMMSEKVYEYVRDMYKNYIPLRGWNETQADQVWDYIGGGKGAFNQTLKEANGRTSIADDPIAYIENMAESGILINNKNWVKQHLMLLAENHPTSLLTLSKAWYVKSTDAAGNETWIPASPQITSGMTNQQVEAAMEAFQKKMEKLEETGDATQQRGHLEITYPQTNSEEREHEVRVMKDGEEYVIYVNGDPQLAQAMNNTRAHRVREVQSGKLDRACAWLGRKMAAAYTSLSPLFIPSNYFRDLTMTLASTAIREDGRYNYLLRKNMATSWNMFGLLMDYKNGLLREKVRNGQATDKEKMFYDFMMNGGETGFVSSFDVEDLKKKFKGELKDMDRWAANPKKVLHTIYDSIEFMNRAIENSNRFAIYMTSIQYGRSIEEAVNNAKDVTLNFNRKGTGENGWQMIRNLYLFINPAVQSLQTLGALAKHHPYKFTAVTSAWMVSGALVPLINEGMMQIANLMVGAMGGGDDDDEYKDIKEKYWQFSKWDRRNNLILWVPFTKVFVEIPLAQEFRGFYAVGDMIASKLLGGETAKESWDEYAEDLMGQVVDMLPLDPTGYDGNIAVSLMPNAVRPMFELAFNVDFTGKPLFKDSEYNKYDPNFTKAYAGTPDWLVRVSRMVNSIGNDYPDVQQNRIDAFGDPRFNLNNPAVVDHVLSSYLGGAYTMGSQVMGVLTKALNDPKEIKMADIPLVSKFVSNPEDRPVAKKQGDEFWTMKENHDRVANTLSKLKKKAKVDGDYTLLEQLYGSEEYKQYKLDDAKVKKYEEDKKKEKAEETGEEYKPHQRTADDVYKEHSSAKDELEDLKMKQIYTKLNGFKTSYDLLVKLAPKQSDGYYNTHKVAIDAVNAVENDKKDISDTKKDFLTDGVVSYDAEKMQKIRGLRKKVLEVLEKANKELIVEKQNKDAAK